MSFKKRVTKSIALALVGVTIAIPMLNTASAMENSKETYSQKIERVSKSFEDFVYLEDNQYKLDISVSELSESSKSDFYIYNDYINLLDDDLSLEQKKRKIESFFDRKHFEACMYCDGFNDKYQRHTPAEQIKQLDDGDKQ